MSLITVNVETGEVTVDKTFVPPPTDPAEILERERFSMVCSKLQGILTLGEIEWGRVLDYRETAPWPVKVVIDSAGEWRRKSEDIALLGYILGHSDEQIDEWFRTAMTVKV